jgi:transcriptional regulator with XRE-family HTH domain
MSPAALLKEVRRRSGLTQAQFAERAGTSQPVISAYENGRRDPGYTTLRRLIEAGGESLALALAPPVNGLLPAAGVGEHAARLADVLSLADAIPRRRASAAVLDAPRLVSR